MTDLERLRLLIKLNGDYRFNHYPDHVLIRYLKQNKHIYHYVIEPSIAVTKCYNSIDNKLDYIHAKPIQLTFDDLLYMMSHYEEPINALYHHYSDDQLIQLKLMHS
jgi:hypothetical protein